MRDLVLSRRTLLRSGALASGALALGPGFWRRAVAEAATVTDGPYGPLGPPDANGIRLPAGFRSRLIARGTELVPGTAYRLPVFPDGQATFRTGDGGWILVTNSESAATDGGASAIRFNKSGNVKAAYRILGGTLLNCSGGPTPWGTWLSGEEYDESNGPGRGAVWECDPTRASQGVRRPALGLFKHEAVCVDSAGQRLYLTEDASDGCFYRFTPDAYPSLASGVLEAAVVDAAGAVTWVRVPDPTALPPAPPTKKQVPEATRFRRGEGIWFDSGTVYVATTSDNKIHAYDTATQTIEVIYDAAALADPPLTGIDNITVAPSGDLFVCENNDAADGRIDVGLLTPDQTISRFLSLTGPQHVYADPAFGPSEATGPAFDPSGQRFYFTSQRARRPGVAAGTGAGAVYEITGPFRTAPAPAVAGLAGPPTAAGQALGSGQAVAGLVLAGAALGIEIPGRVGRDGVPVALTLDEPRRVEARVLAGDACLGTAELEAAGGPVALTVPVAAAAPGAALTVRIDLVDGDGGRETIERAVRA